MSKAKLTLNQLNVLVARPEGKGRALVHDLHNQGIWAEHCSLFSYQVADSAQTCQDKLRSTTNHILIFISPISVEFAEKLLPINEWVFDTIIAVGQATQHSLALLGIQAISPKKQTSEGLLELSILQVVELNNKNIVIIRGDKGRELLFDTLIDRKANVSYAQSYQRKWHLPEINDVNHWLQQPVNCIVVTSVAILDTIFNILLSKNNLSEKSDKIKQEETPFRQVLTCPIYWIVASERIAERAIELGLTHVVNAKSANNQCLASAILELNKI